MESLIGAALDRYVEEHTSPLGEWAKPLRDETYRDLEDPQMQVGRVEGQFLHLMVRISRAKTLLEIGTFSGYSGLAMASALPDDGQLTTCELDPEVAAVARRHFDQTPWRDRIEIKVGPALDTLSTLSKAGRQFDLVFIDADKVSYIAYWEAVLPMLTPGGLILADNTLWNGTVLNPETESARAIVAFNDHVHEDRRVEQVLLSVRDGIMMARKR